MAQKRYLNAQKEAIYRKYIEDRGQEFKPNRSSRYRINDDLYHNLFGEEIEIPEGHKISGKSTLYDDQGRRVLQWVKTSEDKERREQIVQAIIEGVNSKIKKAKPVTFFPSNISNPDIINQYTITDFHLGMLAWHEETGDDWDMDIAEELLISWFKQAIETSPQAEQCIFAQVGDFLHFDGLEAITPQSKHILDADTRFTKLVRVSIRVLREISNMLLKKYKKVHLVMAQGNHDLASSVWLRETFNFYYENEPRITVDTNPDPYYAYSFGSTLLFYHHGHRRGLNNVDSVFVAKFKDIFGKSKNVYAHLGHLHNQAQKETNLMVIEQHRTLASKDAYASSGGWISGRDAKVITYSKDFGEVARLTINPYILKRK